MFSRLSRRAVVAATRSQRWHSTAVATVRASSWRVPVSAWTVAAAAAATAASLYTVTERDGPAHAMFGLADEDEVAAVANRVRALEVTVAGKTNSAFVFVKPGACNDAVAALVKSLFAEQGIRVTGEGELDAATIDRNMLIDNHYGAIAAKAVKLNPSELNVPDKGKAAFQKAFGLSWDDAIAQGQVYNAKQACEKLGLSAEQLDKKWGTLKRNVNLLKFGGGFYCGKVDGIFVMNGFYMNMRSAYTTAPAKIHYFTVQWPTDSLSWEDFRGKVLGATDPATAAKGSLRREILDNYKALGLSLKPNVGENGVHASASPFEALAERMNWLGASPETDAFGRGLLAAGVSAKTISAWTQDPQVNYAGQRGSLFDCLEDLDADTVLQKVKKID